MIDNIKLDLINTCAETLRSSPMLTFYSCIDSSTGEIRTTNKKGKKVMPYEFANFRGLTIKIFNNNRITISGSLHKFYNYDLDNVNDFNFRAFTSVVQELNHLFGILPQNCILRNLEVGVNITPIIDSKSFIENCFLHRKQRGIEKIPSKFGNYKEFPHSQYLLKIYDKGKQYNLSIQLLRFELKFVKMQKLNKLGYFTLNDLVSIGLKPFKQILLKELESVLYFDASIENQTKLLDKYNNPQFWNSLAEDTNKSSLYKKHLSKLRELTRTNSKNILNLTKIVMTNKIDELL